MTPSVDVHAHAMPLSVLLWLESEHLADLSGIDIDAPMGTVRLDPRVSGVAAGAVIPVDRSQWDVEARLVEMDAQGVDVHVVSLPPFLMASTANDEALVEEVVRRGNDALGEMVSAASSRLLALGTAPVGSPGVVEEVERVLGLGMVGVALGTRGGGRELDDAMNESLWGLLSERRVLTFLHPSGVPDLERMADHYLPQLLGYPMETALAVARLVFSGVRDRHDFPLVLAHGGGCLPSVRGRLDLGWDRKQAARSMPLPPSSYLADLYYDTAVFSSEVLDGLIRAFGAGQVVMGTDFPFDLADRNPQGTVTALDLDPADAAMVRGGTIAGLLGLDAVRGVR